MSDLIINSKKLLNNFSLIKKNCEIFLKLIKFEDFKKFLKKRENFKTF